MFTETLKVGLTPLSSSSEKTVKTEINRANVIARNILSELVINPDIFEEPKECAENKAINLLSEVEELSIKLERIYNLIQPLGLGK